ncbi:O-antigen ligase family protein [Phenylobacterium deserti]|uniref:O-antigen ligase family protein n=1 Tax=Phenylobacterium deserti TaxID=1914756 RepID=A0A328ACJ9_9CAUL|nr:O-antigen ligase family protein [Phenylobacterium deserti]RAK52381.1 O-antigen ligase family protein [Phenylobacterium deserti]
MTPAQAPRTAADARDRLGAWCGWVMVGVAVLTPLFAWLGPLGFAPLMALAGLLCLPALRLSDEDRPALIVLLGALIWAAVSTTWSPYQPKHPQDGQAVKLAAELPLYFSAICGARRASPHLQRLALSVLAWGLVALGVLLAVESLTGGRIFYALHTRFYQPIRIDLAQVKIAQTSFVLALLWPVAVLGRVRSWRDAWLIAPIAAGTIMAGLAFKGDAPVIAVLLAALVALLASRWPRGLPIAAAMSVAALFLAMPLIVWSVRELADYTAIEEAVPLSWSWRMGYWSHAIDWILDAPARGWGLDSSRAMGPGIQLHPHNGPLQVWLELGLIGAVAAAAFWSLCLVRLSRPSPSLPAAATLASVAVYLLFACLNFGVWQEWWMGLGALIIALSGMVSARVTPRTST